MADEERCVTGHSVLIKDRGAARHVAQLRRLASVQWGRTLDAKSQSVVSLTGRSCERQADLINQVADATDRYEMVVYRGKRRAWEGPIRQVETEGSAAFFIANDVKDYLDSTPLSKDWPVSTGTPVSESSSLMTERVRTILEHELAVPYEMVVGTGGAATLVEVPRWENLDPPIDVLPHLDIRLSETLLTRSNTVAFQMMVGEHLDALAEGGLDYTVIGRRILIWDSATALYRTRRLSEADFSGHFRVISAGTEHAAISHVSAQRPEIVLPPPPGIVPGVGNAGGANPYTGVWTSIQSLNQEEGADEPTQDELNSQASRGLTGRTPVPTRIVVPDGATLRLSHDLTIDQLIPGAIMPVSATLNVRKVRQDQRLTKLVVTETADGEQIAVTLRSAGNVEAA